MTNSLETAKAIARVARRSSKPILCCFMGIVDVSSGVKYLQASGIPVFRFPENAAKAFGALYRYSQWLNRQVLAKFKFQHDVEKAGKIVESCLSRGQTYLGELDGLSFLKAYGFNTLPTRLAETADQAVAIAEEIGFSVVMKIVSPQIVHKSDAGGVKVGLGSAREVKDAFETIVANAKQYSPDAEITGVLVQKMAPKGVETILGVNRYPIFGPLIMFGLGGIFVEIFKDVVFRFAPINRNAARRMLRGIKGYKLLKGFRGSAETDIRELEKALVRLSDMVGNHPEIMELDINPMLVHGKGDGLTVADCRIILKPTDQSEED